ncbi:MAG: flagellar hook capping protein [Oscillospiraceae bacterium]|nr:flagellar hook capping protein [Oscillospiraceae bacterium]
MGTGNTGSIGNILENRIKYADLFTDKRNSDMSIETFYQLLIAEMSNQDPMDPMSNTEFVSQMASFTSLQVQQEALYYNNANYASSLAGKTVIVARSTGGDGLDVQEGVVTNVNLSGGEFLITVNGQEYPLKNIMEVLDYSFDGLSGGTNGAFATSLIGKYVTIGMVSTSGKSVVEEGIVERIEIKDGQISIVIDNMAYPLSSVAKVEQPEGKEEDEAYQPGGTIGD